MRTAPLLFVACILLVACSRQTLKVSGKDRKRDIALVTTEGTILLRLSDSTPLHRDNFLRLVKARYYDSVLFHRVIKGFMIQAGDPDSRRAAAGVPLGNGGPDSTIAAEFVPSLFHKKGALAAARTGDDVNPEKRSSSSQFYIVQGKTFREGELDTTQVRRMQGRKIPPAQREVYKTLGGAPHLDGRYTVFGEVVKGLDVVDSIAAVQTSQGEDRDRPLRDVRILSAKLVKREE